MKFYRLHRHPSEDAGEGEDWDEWFTSLAAARHRRAMLIAIDPEMAAHPVRSDFAIDRVVLARLPPKTLVERILNRTDFAQSVERVVPPYSPPSPYGGSVPS